VLQRTATGALLHCGHAGQPASVVLRRSDEKVF